LDYANSSIRSEELDVKLAMRCSFAISTQSGPDAVALLARRPVLYIDVLRYSQFFFGTKLATWCPIKMYDFKEQRDWSLLRLCSSHLLLAKRPEDFVGSGLTFTRSTSREIRDYVSDYLNEFHQPAETGVADLRALVNASLQRAMGDYGRRTFGDIVAPVSRKWLKDNETWWFDSR
jgi:putative glycosyltransferase (TIGR04372 family)